MQAVARIEIVLTDNGQLAVKHSAADEVQVMRMLGQASLLLAQQFADKKKTQIAEAKRVLLPGLVPSGG